MSASTHVLDAVRGEPAAGVAVRLFRLHTGAPDELLADDVTDADGRFRWPSDESSGANTNGPMPAGGYRFVFETGAYFARAGSAAFHPEVAVAFTADGARAHYHVPLLLSPYAYSTYRGS